MKNIIVFITTILFTSTSFLQAQVINSSEEQEVMETFELFFNSMKERDTVTLKSILHRQGSTRSFFETFTGNDQRLRGSGGTVVEEFLKSVSHKDGRMGMCSNEFKNVSIKVHQRFAILTANYQCFVDSGEPENQGLYSIHFLKTNKWKIERVTRYVKTENEYYPKGDINNMNFECSAIGLSFNVPQNWNFMNVEEKFTWGLGSDLRLVVDSTEVNSRLLASIVKTGTEARIMVYVTEPKYDTINFINLPESYRLVKKEKLRSLVDKGRTNRLKETVYKSNKEFISGVEFLKTSRKAFLTNGLVIEHMYFDAIINNHLLSIVGVTSGENPNQKEEIESVVKSFDF